MSFLPGISNLSACKIPRILSCLRVIACIWSSGREHLLVYLDGRKKEMESQKSEGGSNLLKILAIVLGLFSLVMCTAIGTLLISRNYYISQLNCGALQDNTPTDRLTFSRKTEWSPVESLRIAEKGIKVVRSYTNDRCYIMPLAESEDGEMARPLVLLPGILSADVIEQIGGEEAGQFCKDLDTYLLKDPNQVLARKKRQTWHQGPSPAHQHGPARAPANPNLARVGLAEVPGGELEFGRGGAPKQGEPGYRPSGLDFPYEQRVPRCMDLVLDCGRPGAVGEVQECFTWVNGVIKMAQRCVAPNKFEIFMTKPPGRILKIAQKQWILCLQRRRQGLRC